MDISSGAEAHVEARREPSFHALHRAAPYSATAVETVVGSPTN